jgi:hypothetical protein
MKIVLSLSLICLSYHSIFQFTKRCRKKVYSTPNLFFHLPGPPRKKDFLCSRGHHRRQIQPAQRSKLLLRRSHPCAFSSLPKSRQQGLGVGGSVHRRQLHPQEDRAAARRSQICEFMFLLFSSSSPRACWESSLAGHGSRWLRSCNG